MLENQLAREVEGILEHSRDMGSEETGEGRLPSRLELQKFGRNRIDFHRKVVENEVRFLRPEWEGSSWEAWWCLEKLLVPVFEGVSSKSESHRREGKRTPNQTYPREL